MQPKQNIAAKLFVHEFYWYLVHDPKTTVLARKGRVIVDKARIRRSSWASSLGKELHAYTDPSTLANLRRGSLWPMCLALKCN